MVAICFDDIVFSQRNGNLAEVADFHSFGRNIVAASKSKIIGINVRRDIYPVRQVHATLDVFSTRTAKRCRLLQHG